MSDDEEFRFRPRPGRVHADAPKLGKAKSFLTQAKKIARQHSNSPSRRFSSSSSPSSQRSRSQGTLKGAKASRGERRAGPETGTRRGLRARSLPVGRLAS